MADITGLTSSSSTSGSYQSQSDLLVQAYQQTEQPKIDTLTQKQTTLENNRSFYNGLYNKISTLYSSIDSFTGETSTSKFATRQVSNSDTSVLTVSASSDAILGYNSIKVNRLASYDILVSNSIDLTNSSKALFSANQAGNKDGLKAGTYEFSIGVGKEEPVKISVAFTGNETNEEALGKIVKAINSNEDIGVNASLIRDTDNSARISLMSKEQGSANSITFSEDKKGVLSALGLDSKLKTGSGERTLFTDTSAGYKTLDYSTLDSKIEINGIPITRSSNTIDNALPGVTLNLLKPQDSGELPVTLQTNVDANQVESLLQPIISAYNDTLSYLRQDTTLMRGDSTVSNLYNNLRAIVSEPVSSSGDSGFRYLTEIGITINSDGTIGISDHDALKTALEDDPTKVAKLFTSPDSFANKVSNALRNLTGSDGIIQAKTQSLSTQIDYTAKKKVDQQARIDKAAESLRKEYENMLSVYLKAQNQYNNFTSMQNLLTGSSTTG